MTIEVLEHKGIYTAYRRTVKRGSDGKLFESVKRINFPFPPPEKDKWSHWAVSLSADELDAGLQIFFDKWNFGNGQSKEREVYQILYNENHRRRSAVGSSKTGNVVVGHTTGLTISGTLNFPVIKK